MSDDNIYCGLLDDRGLESLVFKTPKISKELYKKASGGSEICYFEVPLSSTQVDIFKDLNKKQDTMSAVNALVQFGGSDISVPEPSEEDWKKLLNKLNGKKSKK